MRLGKREISLSHESKIMFPESGIKKLDVIRYYQHVSKHMLPHIQNRPLMLQRFPNGISKKGFFQKEASEHFPEWVTTTAVPKEGGEVNHVVCNNEAVLVYLANQGTLSVHSWLSKVNALDNPDKFIIDLDPTLDDFDSVRRAAFIVKELFLNISVTSFVMTTGSSGVHIVVPLDGRSTFDESRDAGSEIANLLTELHPDVFTTARLKKDRGNKIYLDIQRNAYAQTGIAPYSLRPLPGAPIATPVEWRELEDHSLDARTWNLKNIDKRLADFDDPWKGMRRHAISVQSLKKRVKKLTVKTV